MWMYECMHAMWLWITHAYNENTDSQLPVYTHTEAHINPQIHLLSQQWRCARNISREDLQEKEGDTAEEAHCAGTPLGEWTWIQVSKMAACHVNENCLPGKQARKVVLWLPLHINVPLLARECTQSQRGNINTTHNTFYIGMTSQNKTFLPKFSKYKTSME